MTMSLSSLQLDAFAAVSRCLSFSRAARELHVTQSALSQRISNLEEHLGLTLFVRDRSGVRLTEPGLRLVRYCESKIGLEQELLGEIKAGDSTEIAGRLRIAGYSTVVRSLLLPRLADLLRTHPNVGLEFELAEMRDLPGKLLRGESEFIVLDHRLERAGVEATVIGEEQYVLIESSAYRGRVSVYLDHDSDDTMTERFFKHQGKAAVPPMVQKRSRSFLDEIYAIIDGVRLGLGRAVVPRHLLGKSAGVRVVAGYRPLRVPVVLHHFTQPYYSRLSQHALKALL